MILQRNRRQKPLRIGLVFSLLLIAVTTRADRVDDYIRARMQAQHIPGLSLAVMKEGKILKAKGYGLANVELKVPARPDTVYQIQSMTKQFTATAIMMLVEEGKVGLDDPVSKYLEGTPETWNKVTVRHLLTHTSGIKDYINEPTQSLRLDVTDEEVFKAAVPRPLNFTTGERYSYSNTNYHLLSMILTKVTGKSYGKFLQERVFEPLGMKETRIISLSEIIPNRAAGYRWDGRTLRNGDYVAASVLGYAGGGICSTVLDLAKWDAALYGERLLKKSSLEQMWKPASFSGNRTADYGFGWGLGAVRGHRFVSHSGGHMTGFTSVITRFLDDGLTVVVLTNQSGAANPTDIAEGVARRYLPALMPSLPAMARVNPALYASYAGRYEFANNFMLTITRDKKKLFAAFPRQSAEEILPQSEDTFFFTEREVRLTFVKDNKGEVSGLVWKENGQERRAPRIGPPIQDLKPQSDPDPGLTRTVEAGLQAFAAGGKAVEQTPGITPGARKDFASGTSDLAGMRSLAFVAVQDVAGQGIERHGAKVARILYYKMLTDRTPRYVLVHLTADNLLTDLDVVDD